MSDFEVDVQALKDFAAAVRGKIIGNGSDAVRGLIKDRNLSDYLAKVGPPSPDSQLSFGELHPDFDAAQTVSELLSEHYEGWTKNFQSLLDLLETLATAAETLATNYSNASSYDQVSAKTVDDAYDHAKITPVPWAPGTTSQTGNQT